MRYLGVEDLEELSRFGKPFYIEAQFPGEFVPEVFIENWTLILNAGFGVIFGMYDDGNLVGTLGGMVTPDVNNGDKIATEAFWFVEKSSRGAGLRLLNSFEAWAWGQGVKRINLAHPLTTEMENLSGLYKRKGYRAIEVHYTKEA